MRCSSSCYSCSSPSHSSIIIILQCRNIDDIVPIPRTLFLIVKTQIMNIFRPNPTSLALSSIMESRSIVSTNPIYLSLFQAATVSLLSRNRKASSELFPYISLLSLAAENTRLRNGVNTIYESTGITERIPIYLSLFLAPT